ncbi:ASCH domain-containing protein [Photobacterium kasasachensis]|uniref:ASCH domain-containing protein n=1 Tax=Photobacterium kasasachensis TaxID=2910240 RepID=UPI003D11954D
MIASGEKTLEIRSWKPDVIPMMDVALVQNKTPLHQDGQEDPNGYVVAIIDIVGCKPWLIEGSRRAGCDESEFTSGYLAWEISNIRKLSKQVNVTAKRKFYTLTNSEAKAIAKWSET